MAKVRVHELAKNLNIQAKDIISFLSEKNIEKKSHMSTLENQEIDIVNHKFMKKENGAIVKTEVKTKAEESKTEGVNIQENHSQEKTEADRPKKKSSITAVFNPQNSKQGSPRRQGAQGHPANRRPQQENSRPAGKPLASAAEHSAAPAAVSAQSLRPENVYAKPDHAKLDHAKPDHVKPDHAKPDHAKPDHVKPDNAQPETAADTNVKTAPPERRENVYADRPKEEPRENVYADRPKDKPRENVYANRPQGEPRENVYANRPQGAPRENVYANRPQGEPRENVYANRPQGARPANGSTRPGTGNNTRPGTGYNRPGTGNNTRPGTGNNTRPGAGNNTRPGTGNNTRPGTGYNRPGTGNGNYRPGTGNNNRPGTGAGAGTNRPQSDRNGRPYENNNQRSYTNSRPGFNNTQGDRNNRPGVANRPNQPRGRADQGPNKFGKEAASGVDEIRGKETRERPENRKGNNNNNNSNNNNKRQDHDKLGSKRPERYVNLEKHGGRKRPQQPQPKPVEKPEDTIRTITIPEHLTIKELAEKMKIQPSVIVKKLFLKGTMVTVNHDVDFEAAGEIALEFNCIVEAEIKIDVIAELLKEDDEADEVLTARPPVVCVMGHVDHGKTSLLDAIRSTKVTDREAGGITQHIGASVVSINGQSITFLDTPGHEAFTAMRMRGANATDIAILVVAADDGVMPQTVEAINHAKAAGIDIIVAVNKIDKPNANIERVKQELSEYQLIPEDWGGSTIFCPVSAHTNDGIDNLLEMILLTAEVGELKANANRNARGLVIEARLDKGRGAVATVLVQKGTLKVGESVACGSCYGKVRAMIDDDGKRLKEAGPSTPVEILGLNGVPNAGEVFVSTDTDKEARSFAETFISEGKERLLDETKAKMSLDDLFSQIKSGNVKELAVIVKADVQGSVEAVKQSLDKLSNEEVIVKTIHGGVGAINESDVILASASNAIIIGFNVRPDVTAKATAEREGVDVRLYKVIYNAIEDVEAAMKGMLDPIFEEKVIGHAEVRQIFKSSGIGNIAGSYILDGMFERGCKVRILREGTKIFEGDLASLKRFKDDVKEVKAGYECGLVMDGFNDIQEFDQVEGYKMVEVPR